MTAKEILAAIEALGAEVEIGSLRLKGDNRSRSIYFDRIMDAAVLREYCAVPVTIGSLSAPLDVATLEAIIRNVPMMDPALEAAAIDIMKRIDAAGIAHVNGPDAPFATAPHGRPYIELVSSNMLCRTADQAAQNWIDLLFRYIKDNVYHDLTKTKIWWRIRPEVASWPWESTEPVYKVYGRLFVEALT